jgi:hypothetical protein
MDKGTELGKRDTTLPHRDTFSKNIIQETEAIKKKCPRGYPEYGNN